MQIRRAAQRGTANHGWLQTAHTFSFADYYDPDQMGFRALRVINDDVVAPGQGFGRHPHQDMEIITWVLEGELEHKDSMGTGAVIRPGEAQRMSAGTGVFHSEFNHSKENPVHLLQIWLLPEKRGVKPGYAQQSVPLAEREGKLRLIASRDGAEGSLTLNQDVKLFTGIFSAGQKAAYALDAQRHAWVHVARGEVTLNGQKLSAGDGVALSGEAISLEGGTSPGEVLLFDLA